MNCIHCGSGNTESRGKTKTGKRQTYCKQCKKWFSGTGAPKILLLDIETSHMEFRAWDTGEQYVRWDQITKPWMVICWSAKWLFDKKTFSGVLTPHEAKTRNDIRIVKKIHALMSNADIIITQNGDWFDLKKLNWKFIKSGLLPNNKYHSIDTLKQSRKIAKPSSHALDSVAQELGFGKKSPMVEQDWINAEAGDITALTKMSTYCNNDVFLLEDWYLILRPWMKTHPNLATYLAMYQEVEKDEGRCPRCLHIYFRPTFTKHWYSMAGKMRHSGNCPHCGAVLLLKTEK